MSASLPPVASGAERRSNGRPAPRWSGPPERPASSAGLPASRARVWVGPPLSARAPELRSLAQDVHRGRRQRHAVSAEQAEAGRDGRPAGMEKRSVPWPAAVFVARIELSMEPLPGPAGVNASAPPAGVIARDRRSLERHRPRGRGAPARCPPPAAPAVVAGERRRLDADSALLDIDGAAVAGGRIGVQGGAPDHQKRRERLLRDRAAAACRRAVARQGGLLDRQARVRVSDRATVAGGRASVAERQAEDRHRLTRRSHVQVEDARGARSTDGEPLRPSTLEVRLVGNVYLGRERNRAGELGLEQDAIGPHLVVRLGHRGPQAPLPGVREGRDGEGVGGRGSGSRQRSEDRERGERMSGSRRHPRRS